MARNLEASAKSFCGTVQADCAAPNAAALPKNPKAATVGYLQQAPDRTWQLNGYACDIAPAANAPPTVTPFMVYEQMVRLVPSPGVRAAPGKGTTLVNMETIFWAESPAARSLGTVTLLGHQVALRIHAESSAWDFGDGHTESIGSLGTPYHASDNCATQQCPGFFGHTYTATSAVDTVTATVTWSGQYSIDVSAWQDVINTTNGTNTVTGPASTMPIQVMQARGELVPGPEDR